MTWPTTRCSPTSPPRRTGEIIITRNASARQRTAAANEQSPFSFLSGWQMAILSTVSTSKHSTGSRLRPALQGVFALLTTLLTLHAHAHDPGLSTATLRLAPERLEAVLVFSVRDLATFID